MEEVREWLRQSEYDLDTAQAMLDSRRYIYAVFMCHLAVEKALKAIVLKRTGKHPPRTHNLVYLLELAGTSLNNEQVDFVGQLGAAGVATRLSGGIEQGNQGLSAKRSPGAYGESEGHCGMPERASQVTAAVSEFLAALRRQGINIDAAYVFGSHARGDARPDSDIDLILVSSAFTDMPAWKRWEVLGKALVEVMKPIDPLAYSLEEFNAKKNAEASFLGYLMQQPEVVQFQAPAQSP